MVTNFKEKVERELADKHQKGELRVVKSAKFVESESMMSEDFENTPSQVPRKKRIALSGTIVAVSFK
jgi:hypothetical protein